MELEGRKIALFGAAGAIGQSIAAALRKAGRPYRVVGRTRASLTQSFGQDPLAEIVAWNPDDPESVREAARGIDTIVYLFFQRLSFRPPSPSHGQDPGRRDGVSRLALPADRHGLSVWACPLGPRARGPPAGTAYVQGQDEEGAGRPAARCSCGRPHQRRRAALAGLLRPRRGQELPPRCHRGGHPAVAPPT